MYLYIINVVILMSRYVLNVCVLVYVYIYLHEDTHEILQYNTIVTVCSLGCIGSYV